MTSEHAEKKVCPELVKADYREDYLVKSVQMHLLDNNKKENVPPQR